MHKNKLFTTMTLTNTLLTIVCVMRESVTKFQLHAISNIRTLKRNVSKYDFYRMPPKTMI